MILLGLSPFLYLALPIALRDRIFGMNSRKYDGPSLPTLPAIVNALFMLHGAMTSDVRDNSRRRAGQCHVGIKYEPNPDWRPAGLYAAPVYASQPVYAQATVSPYAPQGVFVQPAAQNWQYAAYNARYAHFFPPRMLDVGCDVSELPSFSFM